MAPRDHCLKNVNSNPERWCKRAAAAQAAAWLLYTKGMRERRLTTECCLIVFLFFCFFFWTEHCFVVGVKETLINSYLNIHFALGWGGFQQWLKRIMKEKRTFLAKLAAQHATSTSKLWQVFYSSFADTWKGGGVSILVITYIHLSQVFAHHINLLYVEHAI